MWPERRVRGIAAAAILVLAGACVSPNDRIEVTGAFQPEGTCTARVQGTIQRDLRLGGNGMRVDGSGGAGEETSAYVMDCSDILDGGRSDVSFVVAVARRGDALRPGTYPIVPHRRTPNEERPGQAAFLGTFYDDRGKVHHYEGLSGTLTITSVAPDPGAPEGLRGHQVLVGATFTVKARAYWHFG